MLAADHLVFHVDIWPTLAGAKLSCCSGARHLFVLADTSWLWQLLYPSVGTARNSELLCEGRELFLGFLLQLDLEEKKWVQKLYLAYKRKAAELPGVQKKEKQEKE